MEQAAKKTFNKLAWHPIQFQGYKIIKRTIKYSIYIIILYFAYEGFMAWQ